MATINISFDIGANTTPLQLRNRIANKLNYQTQVPNPSNPDQMISNPETKAAFVKRKMITLIFPEIISSIQDVLDSNLTEAGFEPLLIRNPTINV